MSGQSARLRRQFLGFLMTIDCLWPDKSLGHISGFANFDFKRLGLRFELDPENETGG